MVQKSMRLKYEPSSEPIHNYVKHFSLNREHTHTHPRRFGVEDDDRLPPEDFLSLGLSVAAVFQAETLHPKLT